MKNFEEYISDLSSLISIESVSGASKKNMPFGEGPFKAIKYCEQRAKDFGFDVINYDNYALEVSFGSGEEIGIMTHLDVVPAGEGWDTPPYTLTYKDGKYFGRGVVDDKGASLLMLYILRELKESKIPVHKKIRLFFGSDEEVGWRDAEYLKTHTVMPEYGFSPDGDFPLTYAEKGMIPTTFIIPKLKHFSSLSGGTVINAVCGKATAIADKDGINFDLLKKHGLTLNENTIISEGISCHGSAPHLGENAIKPLMEYFADMGEDVSDILENFFPENGILNGIKNEQGTLTFSPDIIEEKEGKIYVSCDVRYPYPIEIKDIKKIFDGWGIEYICNARHPAQYVDKEGTFIKTLLNAYNSITGENGKPIAMGGSTFARVFNKGVSFGMQFPKDPTVAHVPNEYISKENLLKTYEIYKKAIFDLVK